MNIGLIKLNNAVLNLKELMHLTPKAHQVTELPEGTEPAHTDLIVIATTQEQQDQAHTLADHYRTAGITTVITGPPVTRYPNAALQHCTTVIRGSIAPVWNRLLEHAEQHRLRLIYDGRFVQCA